MTFNSGYIIGVNTSDGRPLDLFIRKDGSEWQVYCPQLSKVKYDAFITKSREFIADKRRRGERE